MHVCHFVVTLVASLATVSPSHLANAQAASAGAGASESRIATAGASLHARSIGQGQPIIVLHGDPDFDHGYLLPDLDRWPTAIDQRGRGRSADGVRPQDVTLALS